MTPEELQEIIDEVLLSVRTNSKTIAQLTEAASADDEDYIELSGGRKVSIATLKTIFSGGGGDVTVVQTTGQSTTAVMSQKAVTDEVTANVTYQLEAGYAFNNGNKQVGDTASVTKQAIAGCNCAKVDAAPGQKFTVSGFGTNAVRVWVFIDESNTILSIADAPHTSINEEIIAPAGAKYLLFGASGNNPVPSVVTGEPIKTKVSQLDGRVTELEKGGESHADVAEEKAINRRNYVFATANNRTVGQPAQTTAVQTSVAHCMTVGLEGVKKVNIRTSGLNPNSLPYYFVDADGILLKIGTENINLNETMDVPERAVRLYVNYTYVSYPVANPGVTLYYDYNYYVLNHIKNDKPLAGKKVVMLGDSIHEFTEQGIGIVEHFAEMSGATVYRCAVGGAHLSKRAATGYDVPHVVDALTSAEGLAQLEQVLTTEFGGVKKYIYDIVASVDIMEVDYVTILAGTNDWATSSPAVVLGEDGDTTEVNNISGAVKYIIDTLLAKNPKLQVKFFTPIPRAYNADLANFSDTYIPYSGGYLLPDLCKRVMSVCKQSHTPCCDMYWGLGWNKDNLLTFAGGDGVHPYQGFDVMAEHELAFVVGQDKNPGSSEGGAKEVHIGTDAPTGGEVLWIDPTEQLAQTTGQSTTIPMSQKAVTDALAGAGGGDKPWQKCYDTDLPLNEIGYFLYDLPLGTNEVAVLITRTYVSSNTGNVWFYVVDENEKAFTIGNSYSVNSSTNFFHIHKLGDFFVCDGGSTNNSQTSGFTVNRKLSTSGNDIIKPDFVFAKLRIRIATEVNTETKIKIFAR